MPFNYSFLIDLKMSNKRHNAYLDFAELFVLCIILFDIKAENYAVKMQKSNLADLGANLKHFGVIDPNKL